jgi:hypothetical protein
MSKGADEMLERLVMDTYFFYATDLHGDKAFEDIIDSNPGLAVRMFKAAGRSLK